MSWMLVRKNSWRFCLTLLTFSALGVPCQSAVHAQDAQEITISMSSYEDLLQRLESVESRVPDAKQTVPKHRHRNHGVSASQGGYYGSYELVVVNPVYSNSTAFYEHDTVPGSPESARLTEFDWDLEESHRFELGYLSPSTNLGWRARYWFFDSQANEDSPTDADVKVGVADDPDIAIDTVNATDPDFLRARASTEVDAIDLEGVSKRFIYHNLVTFSAGLRYAKLEHAYLGLDVDPTLAGPNNVQTALRTDFNFEGVGPTVSLASWRRIGSSHLGWNIEGRTSLLFGQGDARWERLDNNGVTGNPLAIGDVILHDNETRLVPVTELRLGLDYQRDRGNVRYRFSTGFEGQVWINGGTPLNAGQDGATDSDGIMSPWTEDLGFIGFFFGGSASY